MRKILTLFIGVIILLTPFVSHGQVSGSLLKLQSNVLLPVNSAWQFELPYLGGSGSHNVCADNNGLFYVSGCTGGGGSSFGTTSISATAPLQWNTTTATMSITQSGLATNGYLSFTDFNTFNNKISSTSLSVTTIGTSGAATYTPSTGVFNIPQYSSGGSTFGKTWEINAFNALAPTTTIGIEVNASSTIGDGSATGGLIINGGATTTGNMLVSGNTKISGTLSVSSTVVLSNIGSGLVLSTSGILSSYGGTINCIFGIGSLSSNGDARCRSTDFTATTNFGAFASATGTPIWFQAGLQASSTSYFPNGTWNSAGNVGIGTTSPGSLLSVGNTNGINFSIATSTFNSTGGINLTAGCYAFGGVCLTAGAIGGGSTQAVNWATTAVLAGTPTYSNGTAGVGGTLTEVGTGALSVDSNSPAAGDRVLVKNQASALQNGIYSVTATGSGIASYILTRATDYNSPTEITPGINTYVLSGTVNSDSTWAVSFTPPLVIGTNSLTYAESSAGGTVTSVAASVPAFLSISGSPITSSGTLAITYSGTALPIANGGTNSTATPGLNSLLYFNGSGMVATSSQPLYVGSLFATSTTLASYFAGSLGIGSTTPLATFSVGSGTASSSILVAEYAYGKTGNNATSTAATLSPRTANTILWPIGNAATTLTLCNLQPGDNLTVVVINPNATAGALTWTVCAGSQLYWPAGTVPTQTTTANKQDVWSFKATDAIGSTSPSVILIKGAQTANF